MIYKYIIIGLISFGTLSSVASIGKERKPTTPIIAMVGVILATLEILAIVLYWK